jgi:phosphonate transport system substrate-binding protein
MRGIFSRLAGLALAAIAAAMPVKPAGAGWQDDIGTFRIGLVAESGAGNTIAGLAVLTDAYTKALGMKVEFFVARDYAALIEAQAASQLEYSVLSATAYATAFERCKCVEPLVAPVGEDGSVGIRSVLIARIGTLVSTTDLERYRIAILPPENIAGFQLPVSFLSLPTGPLTGSEPFLVHAESAVAAEAMLAEGKVDALFGWIPALPAGAAEGGGTLARLEAAGVPASDLLVIWKSDVLRFGPHAVRTSLDPEPKRRLSVFLTNLKESDPDQYELLEQHHLGGFEPASPADYAAALAVVRRLKASE